MSVSSSTDSLMPDGEERSKLLIGWSEADITPPQPVIITGMFYARLSEGVSDPLTATAWAIDSGDDQAVIVSCDLICISDDMREAVLAKLIGKLPGLDPAKIMLCATHTHSGPETRIRSNATDHLVGGASGIDLEAMAVADYVAYAAARIAEAIEAAWTARAPGGIAYGLGYAVVGNNRRWVNSEGIATMGWVTPALNDTFRHIEGYEDHTVNVMAIYDAQDALTGLVVNVPCPSQRGQSEFTISADWWHEVRSELRRRLGSQLFVLPQCSAAGDQYSFLIYEQKAKLRMMKLQGRTEREETAHRIVTAVMEMLPALDGAIERTTHMRHEVLHADLPAYALTEEDVRRADADAAIWKQTFEQERRKLADQPEQRSYPRWYVEATKAYGRMKWNQAVASRYEQQQSRASYPAELHALRLGDVAFATNPFECYLDFGVQMKVRSPATQTFLVQLAGSGTYLPSPRSVSGGGYGSVPASNTRSAPKAASKWWSIPSPCCESCGEKETTANKL
ncbi:MAG: hypothetical protein K0Q59_5110 [Paenibacillus sp.]|nr:hypothetical protein [Paenibacillus sp.]